MEVEMKLKNLLNLRHRAALWGQFCGGRKESEMRKKVETSEFSKSPSCLQNTISLERKQLSLE